MHHIYGNDHEQDERFDRIRDRIKDTYEQQGKTLTDEEAIAAANNLIGFVGLLTDIRRRKINERDPAILEELADLKKRYEAGDPEAVERIQSVTDNSYTPEKFLKRLEKYLKDKKIAA